jgi:hypothetical protein
MLLQTIFVLVQDGEITAHARDGRPISTRDKWLLPVFTKTRETDAILLRKHGSPVAER